MSAAALQRVVVRLLHDPSFVARVYDDPAAALADVDLTADERRWLVSTDRRRFSADPLRPRRVLRALLDEFRASSALLVQSTRRLATLEHFFGSPEFHRTIQHRGSLAGAFAAYLRTFPLEPRALAVLALEEALAVARRGRIPSRAAHRLSPDVRYVLSTHVAPLEVPAGALAVFQAVEQVLFELSLNPLAALADDGPDLLTLPALGTGAESYLAELGPDGQARLGESSPALVALLVDARTPRPGEALLERARTLGADAAEAGPLLQGLVDDALLVPALD